jgi:DNA-binding phage protein
MEDPDPESIKLIQDPIARYQAFLAAMERTRELHAALALGRGLAVYELYVRDGASKAARQLGMSRAGLYKIIAEYAPDEVKEARRRALAGVAVAVAAAATATQLQANPPKPFTGMPDPPTAKGTGADSLEDPPRKDLP